MSFQLKVVFSGLCLYVVDTAENRVGVVMPDARGRTEGSTSHADKTTGERHVGYVRFDLADAAPGFPPLGGRTPHYEGVHLFDGEELQFLIDGEAGTLTSDIALPECEQIAPDPDQPGKSFATPLPSLFKSSPPASLLMRTVLSGGGTFVGEPQETWRFANLWRPGMPQYEDDFASFLTWRRTVESVTLRISRFDKAAPPVDIPLKPPANSGQNAVVEIKVANFCSINPLEWKDLGRRAVKGDDVDFKWLYRLLTPRDGTTWEDKLRGEPFPIPLMPPGTTQGVEDCIGLVTQGSTT